MGDCLTFVGVVPCTGIGGFRPFNLIRSVNTPPTILHNNMWVNMHDRHVVRVLCEGEHV